MIKIGNKNAGDEGIYCGRNTPLGNPYPMPLFTRNQSCDFYNQWLHRQIETGNSVVVDALNELLVEYKTEGEMTLLCACAPRRCHCDSIKEVIEEWMKTS